MTNTYSSMISRLAFITSAFVVASPNFVYAQVLTADLFHQNELNKNSSSVVNESTIKADKSDEDQLNVVSETIFETNELNKNPLTVVNESTIKADKSDEDQLNVVTETIFETNELNKNPLTVANESTIKTDQLTVISEPIFETNEINKNSSSALNESTIKADKSDEDQLSVISAPIFETNEINKNPSVIVDEPEPREADTAKNPLNVVRKTTFKAADPNNKTPLLGFGTSFSLGMQLKGSPLAFKISYGFGKSKIHSAGISYNFINGLSIGSTFLYGIGHANNYKHTMPVYALDFGYTYNAYPISPYITFSLGNAQHHLQKKSHIAENYSDYSTLMYGLNTGTLIDLTSKIKIDITYKITNFGFKKEYRGGKSQYSSHASLGLKIIF